MNKMAASAKNRIKSTCQYPVPIGLFQLSWLVGCFGLNGPFRQYFSLYRAVPQREGERKEVIDERKNVKPLRWSGGAMVLGKCQVPGRPTILIRVGQGPTALAVGAGGGCLDLSTLIYLLSLLSLSLGDGRI